VKLFLRISLAGLLLALTGVAGYAQFRRGGGGRGYWGGRENLGPIVQTEPGPGQPGTLVDERTVRTARETATHSGGPPNWTNAPGFEKDVFTFTRIIYKFARDGSSPRLSTSSSPWGWITDYPDSDLNLSFRVQQVTSMRVDPDGRVLHLTDPALLAYPFIYIVEPGRMVLREEEVPILRNYLKNGGVLWVDDFWGQKQWDNMEYEIKRAVPEGEFVELPMEHPIFHCVFDIQVPKNLLQTPAMQYGIWSLDPKNARYGVTWEFHHDDYDNADFNGRAAHDMHVRAMLDGKGRIMVIATHNCDMGDSWEREGEDDSFFHEFSEKRGFPLGINVIFYLMTH
jgi:hypothetical protein